MLLNDKEKEENHLIDNWHSRKACLLLLNHFLANKILILQKFSSPVSRSRES